MSPKSPGRTSPASLVALLVLTVALVLVLRVRGGPAPADACDPAQGDSCSEAGDSGWHVPPGGAAERNGPVVRAWEICGDAGYLCADLATDSQVVVRRWTRPQGTLVVHVPRPALSDAATAQALQRAATAGVRVWNKHPYPILVDERGTRPADIEVRWTPALSGTELGVTRTQWSRATGLQVLSLELATRSPTRGGTIDPRQVRLTAAHEMGHALGLPHSNDPRDLMYPQNTATSLTAQDFRTLEELYRLEDGTRIVR